MRTKPGLEHGHAINLPAVDEQGNIRNTIGWVLTEEEFAQTKDGRRCLKCMEPLNPAFPVRCPLCSYEVKSRQTIDLIREHQGHQQMGPTPDSVLDEIDRENAERDKWRKTDFGILVP